MLRPALLAFVNIVLIITVWDDQFVVGKPPCPLWDMWYGWALITLFSFGLFPLVLLGAAFAIGYLTRGSAFRTFWTIATAVTVTGVVAYGMWTAHNPHSSCFTPP